ncbi:MAG: D-alanyl-D-alanine carboxypeptidase family protein [Planctomycetota bacterium]
MWHGNRPETEAALIERVADGSGGLTRLAPGYLYTRLVQRADAPEVSAAFDRLRVGDMPAAHADLIRALELEFIHSPDTSSLDLLGPELGGHFRTFAWHEHDYPGGPEGPNELLARMLADALDVVTPERRANRARAAVIRRDEATDELWDYMLAQWRPVPDETSKKLNRHAVESYVKMRAAAEADGVDLTILSGHRDPARARQNAARVGNSFAVASFSSHSLGLAIDVALPRAESDQPYRLRTRPMADVVAMRQSPVHKWLHLHGHKFGWYPFQHEPWHWEFNPPGFREVFFADFPDGPPPREPGSGPG